MDELAHEIAQYVARRRHPNRQAVQRHSRVVEAYRERVGVEDYMAHQFGHVWRSAHIHKSYADHEEDTPTGYVAKVGDEG